MPRYTYFNAKRNERIDSDLEHDEAIKLIETRESSPFVRSLMEAAKGPGSRGLSDAQLFWVHKIANEVKDGVDGRAGGQADRSAGAGPTGRSSGTLPSASPSAPPPPASQTSREELAGLEPIVEILTKASRNLKHPAIELSEHDIRLSVAGSRSKYVGQIHVTSCGSFHDRTWYGRIDTDGVFHPSSRVEDRIYEALARFALDPAAFASEHGKKTGQCCFCNRKLEDERSTEVGYGPVCAEHYGLTWGSAKSSDSASASAKAKGE